MKICMVCHAESPDNARFCGFCGSRFIEPQVKICPSCGAELLENANFCTNCGYSFVSQAGLAVRPLIERQVIEIEPTSSGVNDRFSVIIKKIMAYFRRYPLRSLAILAFILLIPLCCVINAAFAVRDRISGAEAPNAEAISTFSPSKNPTSTSTVMLEETTSTPTLMPPASTSTLMSTITPTQFLVNTGFSGCPPLHTTQEVGKVDEVIDGDTIDVILDGKTARVRYIGIDAAEAAGSTQTFGAEAYQKNKDLLEGKDVILVADQSNVDVDNRLLRYVFLDDIFVNHELVRAGYAKIFPSPPDTACDDYFLAAQQAAAQAALGLWGASLTGVPATRPAVRMVQPTPAVVPTSQVPAGDAACDCTGPDLNCKDFATGAQAQACYEHCKPQYGDIYGLDRDKDGLACETQ